MPIGEEDLSRENQREKMINDIEESWRKAGFSEEDIEYIRTHTIHDVTGKFGWIKEPPWEKRQRRRRNYKEMIPKIENDNYDGSLVLIDLSGFGATYVDPISAGLKYLKIGDPEKDEIIIGEQTDIYYISQAKNDFTGGLYKTIQNTDPDSHWELFGSINNCKMIWEYGYKGWLTMGMRDDVKLVEREVDEGTFNLFHSFEGNQDLPEPPEIDFWDGLHEVMKEHEEWLKSFIKPTGRIPSCCW